MKKRLVAFLLTMTLEAEAPKSEYVGMEEAKGTENEKSYLDGCYDFDTEVQNGEEYSEWEEKGYSSVMKDPLSTFSADVDTASYSNLRRLIRDGYSLEELPEHAVKNVKKTLKSIDLDDEYKEEFLELVKECG